MKRKKPYNVDMNKATAGVQKNFYSGVNRAMAGSVIKTGGRVAGLIGLAELGFGKNKKRAVRTIIGGTAAQIGGHFLEKHGLNKAVKAGRQASYQKKTRLPLKKRKR